MKRILSLALVLVMLCGVCLCTAEAAAAPKAAAKAAAVRKETTVPKAPKLTSATSTAAGCQIVWSKVSCTSYTIYRKTAKTGWSVIGTTKANDTTSFTDTTAVSGTTYTYTMRAVNSKGRSNYDKKGITLLYLSSPQLTATNVPKGIAITWDYVQGAKKYVIYRKTAASSDWTRIGVMASSPRAARTSRGFTDKFVTSGVTYSYTVRAYSGPAKGSYYTDVSCKYLSMPVVSVAAGTYTPENTSANTVSWSAVAGADSYTVYRRTTGTDWIIIASNITETSFVDTTADSSVISTYTVRAVSGTDRSSFYYAGACAWNQGTSSLESSFNFYKAAVNAVQAGYAGYTKSSRFDNLEVLINGEENSTMTSLVEKLLAKNSEKATPFTKGSIEAKAAFPVCTLTDLSKLKSCVMTDEGSYYHVEIVTLGEENPTKDSFLNQLTTGILTADNLNDPDMEDVTVSNAAVNYNSVTMIADIAKDGCFKSLSLKSDIAATATVTLSGMSAQDVSISLTSNNEYKAFNY